MTANQTSQLLKSLHDGKVSGGEIDLLEKTSAEAVVAQLQSQFPVLMQERRLGDKWEIALARQRQQDSHSVPGFTSCLFINSEEDRITGISRIGSVRLLPLQSDERVFAFITGPGFKLDKTPDGWSGKRLQERSVRLSEVFLQERGWQMQAILQPLQRPPAIRE